MPSASFIELVARAHASPHGSTSPSLSTKHFNIHLLHLNVFILTTVEPESESAVVTPSLRWLVGGGGAFRSEQMSRGDWTHAKTAGHAVCTSVLNVMKRNQREKQPSLFDICHNMWQQVSPLRCDHRERVRPFFLLGSCDTCHLRRAGGGWHSRWALVKIIFPLWALLTRPRFK